MFLRSKVGLGLVGAMLALCAATSGAMAGERHDARGRGHDRGRDGCGERQVYVPRYIPRVAYFPRHVHRPVYRPVVACAPVVVQRPVVCAPAPVVCAPVYRPTPVIRAGVTIVFND